MAQEANTKTVFEECSVGKTFKVFLVSDWHNVTTANVKGLKGEAAGKALAAALQEEEGENGLQLCEVGIGLSGWVGGWMDERRSGWESLSSCATGGGRKQPGAVRGRSPTHPPTHPYPIAAYSNRLLFLYPISTHSPTYPPTHPIPR